MDPSLSAPNDPHHSPPFTAYPNPFAVHHHPFYSNPVNSSAVAPPSSSNNNNNNQFYQPQPQPHPTWVHPPYSEMICCAIAALNEADGSSKQAISRYIERTYTGIPTAHGALMTHHLKSLKNSGVLVMVKKSYKLAAASSVAAAEPPRSDFTSNYSVNQTQPLPDLAPTSTQKRGRGRPPKAKPDAHTNGLPVLPPQAQPQSVVKRPPGRPRKDGALPTVKTPAVSGGVETAKRRGRPPSGRAAGRERKPAVVSAPASVIPYVPNGGVRRRGRPKRVDAGASSAALPSPPPPKADGGGSVVVAKRGRGRPPKIGGVMRKPMKPKRGGGYVRTGRPLGRPRKSAAAKGASRQQDIGFGELQKKFKLFQEKAKEIVNVLKAEVGGSGNHAVVQAIQALEELTVTTTEEPQHMEEVQPDEQHHGNEQEPEGHGQGQALTEAEAMQEALF
ncbi:unnamed protein product [Brassica oleracea]